MTEPTAVVDESNGFRFLELPSQVAGFARRVAARLARLPDPWLHGLRRKAAVARLPDHISEILIVCYGNICRSPYAAAALAREMGPAGPVIRSVGFFGPDRPSPDRALEVARERQLPLDSHRSTVISAPVAASADMVLVMESNHARQVTTQYGVPGTRVFLLGDFDPERIVLRAIPDPYGKEAAVFDACYARIERCIGSLVSAIRARDRQIQPRDQ
jgi:protein-tyrosine phosphatase